MTANLNLIQLKLLLQFAYFNVNDLVFGTFLVHPLRQSSLVILSLLYSIHSAAGKMAIIRNLISFSLIVTPSFFFPMKTFHYTEFIHWLHLHLQHSNSSPDQCGSVGWACPSKYKVAGLFPSRGTCLGCGPQLGHIQEATNRCFSPSLSPSLPFSLKINK